MHSDPHIIVRAFDPRIDHMSCEPNNVELIVVEPIRDKIPDVPALTEGMRYPPNRKQRRQRAKLEKRLRRR